MHVEIQAASLHAERHTMSSCSMSCRGLCLFSFWGPVHRQRPGSCHLDRSGGTLYTGTGSEVGCSQFN